MCADYLASKSPQSYVITELHLKKNEPSCLKKHDLDYEFAEGKLYFSNIFAQKKIKVCDLGMCTNTSLSRLCSLCESTSTFKGKNRWLTAAFTHTSGS